MPMMRRPLTLAELVFPETARTAAERALWPEVGQEVNWPIDASAITPAMGAIRFGTHPGLKAYLEQWARRVPGDAPVPSGTRLPGMFTSESRAYVGPNVRPPTVEPGGAGVPGVMRQRPGRLDRLLSEEPRQQFKDLQLYRKMLEDMGMLRGAGTGQYGPGISLYDLPKGEL